MKPTSRHFILATAGHVDHGKSSLVQALTGTDPDRLPEEKKRGISIELGFAELRLPSPGGELIVGIVDVPGHEDFVKTMAAGVSAADAALLVIAADDGPMPQTFEHLDILEYFGVRRGIIALSKIDLVDDPQLAIEQTRAAVAKTIFAKVPIVPVSLRPASNLDDLRARLTSLLSDTPAPRDTGKPRLWIDRAFSSKGAGTIVTGTLVDGPLRRGDSVFLEPGHAAAHIRSLHSHHRAADHAEPGSRVALNLPELSLASAHRGRLISADSNCSLTSLIDVALLRSSHTEQPLPHDGTEVHVLVGSAHLAARVYRFESEKLIRLKLAASLPILAGDRLIVRSSSDRITLAGGIVVDPAAAPARRWRSNAAQLAFLHQRAAAFDDLDALILSLLARDRLVSIGTLSSTLRFSQRIIAERCETLAAAGRLRWQAPILVSIEAWQAMLELLCTSVTNYHQQHSQNAGLPVSEARQLLIDLLGSQKRTASIDAIIEPLFRNLEAQEIRRVGNILALQTFRPQLPPRLQQAGARLRAALERDGLNPLIQSQLAPTDVDVQALRFLVANGEAIDLGGGVTIATSAYVDAVRRIRQYLSQNTAATVSELKSLLGSSRRVMVPLLERLDREGITRRSGDRRSLPAGR